MEINPQDQKTILQLVEQGVDSCTSKLAAISKTDWQLRTTSMKAFVKADDYIEKGHPSQYYFGAFCQSSGRVFLAFFNSRSAELITKSFISGSKGLQATPDMQEVAICEIANIVINAVAGSLADRCGMAFILSAPKPVRGAKADMIKAAFGDFSNMGKVFGAYIHLSSQELAADCTLMLMLDDLFVNFILNALDK
ncbi:MAG: hypothetical protein WC881_00560 [Elusimicrobiota bacterium]|jgi:chemotaxis protein CheY-P-specific phosphatase CheC